MWVDERHTHKAAGEPAAGRWAATTQPRSVPKAVPSQPTHTAVTSSPPVPGFVPTGVKGEGEGVEKSGKGQRWDTGEIEGKAKGYRM